MMPFKTIACCASFFVVVNCGSSSGGGGSSGSSSMQGSGSLDGGGTEASLGALEAGVSGATLDAGATGTSGAAAGGSGTAGLSWDDNGTAHTAYSAEAILGTSSNPNVNLDTLEIVAVELPVGGLSIALSGPPPLGGTYTCVVAGAAFVEFTYELMADVQTCSVTITLTTGVDGGQHVTGMFSAVAMPADGGTHQLTGQFSLPVIPEN
jgi:hypothetical protein